MVKLIFSWQNNLWVGIFVLPIELIQSTEFNIFVEGNPEANIFDKCDNYLRFAFENKNIYDLLFSQSVVEFLKFPNLLPILHSPYLKMLHHYGPQIFQ